MRPYGELSTTSTRMCCADEVMPENVARAGVRSTAGAGATPNCGASAVARSSVTVNPPSILNPAIDPNGPKSVIVDDVARNGSDAEPAGTSTDTRPSPGTRPPSGPMSVPRSTRPGYGRIRI